MIHFIRPQGGYYGDTTARRLEIRFSQGHQHFL